MLTTTRDIYFDPTKFKGFGKLYGLDMTKWPKKKFDLNEITILTTCGI